MKDGDKLVKQWRLRELERDCITQMILYGPPWFYWLEYIKANKN